ELAKLSPVSELESYGLSTEQVRDLFSEAEDFEDLARRVEDGTKKGVLSEEALKYWTNHPEVVERLNQVRGVLGLTPLGFIKEDSSGVGPEKRKERRSKKQK